MTNKIANPNHPILELFQQRWSPRSFADKPVAKETLLSLLEAARWTASSRNEQPWRFIITTKDNPAEYKKLLACINETNQVWAKNAPVLLLAITKTHFSSTGTLNKYAFYDVGAAVTNLIMQATAMDLYAHQIGSYSAEKAHQTYNLSDDYQPVVAVALGYLGQPEALPDSLHTKEVAPRERKPLDELVLSDL